MRILIIRNAFFYDFGGGERFPVHLAQELVKNGHAPVVMSKSPKLLGYARAQHIPVAKGWWWHQQNWSGLRIILVPLYVLWQILLTLWYTQLLLRQRIDTVHPQSKDDFIAATLAGRLLSKRVIWTDHADLKYVFANHQVWYKNPVGKLVYACSKLAHAITLVSHSEQKLIEEALGHPAGPKYVVIHNGVLDQRVNPVERKNSNEDAVVFCATSRLVAAKGIGELIEAFSSLAKKYEKARLWLVGDGPEREHFKKLAGGQPAITFVGHTDEVLSYLAASDIFVHPSYHEGFSISLVEAAMLGKPLIACDVGGNPEIVEEGKTGLLIPARDAAALKKAMEQLLVDAALRHKLGKQARQSYEQNFQFDTLVKDSFLPLYEK